MKNYCTWVVSPPGYIHSHAFDLLALSLSCAFREIGYDIPIVRDIEEITDYPIVLGCNLLPSLGNNVRLPQTSILYNTEQIQTGSPWMTEDYLNLLRMYEVWHYSRKNIDELRNLGITNVKFCELGYVPEMTRIKPVQNDIDILWYGSLNERRLNILKQLHNMGFKVEALFGVYGKELDRYIARSRIVLNIHYYEARIFEIVRVSYLLANKKFVISETGSDEEMEKPFYGSLVFAPYENLVEECAKYIQEDNLRAEIARKGFSRMKSLNQVQFLKDVLT